MLLVFLRGCCWFQLFFDMSLSSVIQIPFFFFFFRLLSSGPDHGVCVCGNCSCSGNWTGPSCSCTKSKEGCMKDGVRLSPAVLLTLGCCHILLLLYCWCVKYLQDKYWMGSPLNNAREELYCWLFKKIWKLVFKSRFFNIQMERTQMLTERLRNNEYFWNVHCYYCAMANQTLDQTARTNHKSQE